MTNQTRKREIDGLRGLAILLVVLFHFYVRWSSVVPYGDRYADSLLFKHGGLGVQLFFMISGYVIFMTLDTSVGFLQFLRKRWTRLFPAMLLTSLLIFATAPLLPERPAGQPQIIDLLPGLVFVEARWLHGIFHVDIQDLEGVFWSLYAEVRFYLLVAALYFFAGRSRTVPVLIGLALFFSLLQFAGDVAAVPSHPLIKVVVSIVGEVLVGRHMAWFLIGILTYLNSRGRATKWARAQAVLVVALALSGLQKGAEGAVVAALVICLFLLVAWHGKLTRFFSGRPFIFFGMVSYPLYLMHENAGVAIIIKAGHVEWIPFAMLPVLALVLLAIPAYLMARYIEPRLQRLLSPRKIESQRLEPVGGQIVL